MNNKPINDSRELLTAIANTPARKNSNANIGTKQKVSRRILIARSAEEINVVCPLTGTVFMMAIPSIPGYVLEWTSPLTSLSNCRGIVQQGFTYLESLDTQILAALLITIADSYSLLKYAPSDTGAQKNAILRTAGKLTLVNCLLLIEEYINSHNRCFLPALSLLFDTQVEQSGIEGKLTEWMKLIAAVILKSNFPSLQESSEDTFYSASPTKTITPDYIRTRKAAKNKADKAAKSINWAETNKKWAEQRVYKEDIKAAKNHIKSLCAEEEVSAKLQGLLKSVFHEDSLLTMDSSMRALLSLKMSAFSSEAAKQLIEILDKPYTLLRTEVSSLCLDDDLPTVCDTAEEVEPNNAPTIIETIASETIEATPQNTIKPRKSFVEILLAKKIAASATALIEKE